MSARYEITTFEPYTPGTRAADRSITTGLMWEDVVKHLSASSLDRIPAEAFLSNGKFFHYHDKDGRLCRLTLAA